MKHIPLFAFSNAYSGFSGCKADPPGSIERFVVEQAKHKVFVRNKSHRTPRLYAG